VIRAPGATGRRKMLRPLSDQRVRFLIAGGFNTAFGYGLFVALHFTVEHAVGYLVILTMSWVVGVLEAFIAYRYFVFRVRGSFLLDLGRFSLVYIVFFLINLAVLPLLVEVAAMPVLLAQAAALAVTAVASYVAHHRFSFRRTPEASNHSATSDGAR
jgi:putative flippase GtrA